ncbi:MAG TPA: site-specific integrase [Daejeonella sp.]|uniref:site-specific integrase n=1 Tax=Daejeonella sp. TaxID=2805397 RepID=UPI002ED95305
MNTIKIKPAKNHFSVKVNFNLRNTKPSNLLTPVRCIVRYNNERIVLPSYFHVEPRHWNTKQQTVRSNQTDNISLEINKTILRIKGKIAELFDSYVKENRTYPPIPMFRQLLLDKVEQPEEPNSVFQLDLIEFTDAFIKGAEQKKTLTVNGKPYAENTLKIYRTLKRNLTQFKTEPIYKKVDLKLNVIGLEFFENFKDYMIDKLDYSKNTVAKHLRVLKVLLAEAKETGLIDTEFKGKRYQAPTEETESIYLNENEIQDLLDLDLTKEPSLDRIRDLFLVGCWTGLRFSDFHDISPANIKGEDIEIKTQKTGVRVVVPIHDHIKTLMAKYNGKTENSLPPTISNQKLNEGIKKIAKRAGISESVQIKQTKGGKEIVKSVPKYDLVSSHTARRSFASNMYLANAKTISIMAITGHKTESSFMKYIRITPKEHSEKIREIWQNKPKLRVVSDEN